MVPRREPPPADGFADHMVSLEPSAAADVDVGTAAEDGARLEAHRASLEQHRVDPAASCAHRTPSWTVGRPGEPACRGVDPIDLTSIDLDPIDLNPI
jgi:hypothetical protein